MNSCPDFLQIPYMLIQDTELQKLDWLVYGVVYWSCRLALRKCILSNQAIAEMLFVTKGSVANSVSRLSKQGYVKVILGENGETRKEIVPLVYYRASSTNEPPLHLQMNTPSSTDEHIEKIYIEEKRKKNSSLEQFSPVKEKSNYGVSHSNLGREALSEQVLWEIAMKKNAPLDAVRQIHQQVLDSIEQGDKYKVKSVNLTLQNWLRRSMQRGEVSQLDEVGRMLLESDEPTHRQKAEEIFDLVREKNL